MAKKKAAKKSLKKTSKKAKKPVYKKATPKKPSKKVVTKKVVKKVAKTVAPKKKLAKKVAKKPVTKKASGKTVAVKPAPKTPAVSIPPGSVAEAPPPNPKVPSVGETAPSFTLASSTGQDISLEDYAGETVVLYFYPKADTPGCTVQACGFRDSIADYGKAGLNVLGISPDPVEAVTDFAQKFNLNFPLLADADHRICEAYGVWVEKKMYGKTYMGAARTTFVIHDGKVQRVFEKVNPQGHEKEVLESLEGPH